MKKPKKPSRAIPLQVTADGKFAPADDFAKHICRKRKYRVGDVLMVEIKQPRSYGQWKKAHKLATLLIENIDDFHGWDEHRVLKRLQLETGAGCDDIPLKTECGTVLYRIPRSFNFAEMLEDEFQEIYAAFCKYIEQKYWPGLTPDQIEDMSGLVGMSA